MPGVHALNANCKTEPMPRLSEPSPYVEFDRSQWRALRMSTPLKLSEDELLRLRGLGEKLDLLEVEEVYLPLARLIHLQVAARQALFATTAEFLGEPQQNPDRPVPFIIGVAGSVAVGKSTTARVLQALLARWEHHPRVDLVTTDGFLYPNAELARRNLMHRKGFPESYDRRALMRFVTAVKSGSRRGVRTGLFTPALRHRPRREADDPAPGHPHPRGPQRAADRSGADGVGPVRLLGLRRRPHRGHRAVVHLPVPVDARRARSPIRRRTSTTTRR